MKEQYKYFVSFTYHLDLDKRHFDEDIIDYHKPIDNLEDILNIKALLSRGLFPPKDEINIVNICRL